MATTTKLIVYNDVLRELGSHPLSSISDTNGGTRLQELNGAFDHAVEYMLAKVDWNFARRRATLTGTADTAFSPYTYRYARPSDYLRKVWIKSAASDDFQIDHAESGAVFYAFSSTALMEYMSDTSSNYEPANWPPQFTRCIVLYLALLVGPKLGRTGDDDAKGWYQKLDMALADAERQEAVYTVNAQIDSDRIPTIRRAIEILGQQTVGTVALNSKLDELRWAMNRAWDDCFAYVLAQGAWNFATKRALFSDGAEADANVPSDEVRGIIEGYSVGTVTDAEDPALAGFTYGYPLPTDFAHKVWIRATVNDDFECTHQIMADYIFTNEDPCVMEYIASDSFTEDPANWPHLFREAVAAYLALSVAPELVIAEGSKGARVQNANARDRLEAQFMRKLSDAKMKDAIQQEPKTIPLGRFARARFGSIGTTSIRRYN